jgi:hypothetical protein
VIDTELGFERVGSKAPKIIATAPKNAAVAITFLSILGFDFSAVKLPDMSRIKKNSELFSPDRAGILFWSAAQKR